MALMLATELLTGGRIIAGGGAITHESQLFRRKELELSHASIISDPPRERCPVGGFRLCKINGAG
jgi:hypothetical protein